MNNTERGDASTEPVELLDTLREISERTLRIAAAIVDAANVAGARSAASGSATSGSRAA